MKLAFNEYYEMVMKPALSWLRKHWRGYVILTLVVFGIMEAGFLTWWYSDKISEVITSIKEVFTKKKEAA